MTKIKFRGFSMFPHDRHCLLFYLHLHGGVRGDDQGEGAQHHPKSKIFSLKLIIVIYRIVLWTAFCGYWNEKSLKIVLLAMWRHKNEGLSIYFWGVFFPASPLIYLIFMTSHGWFLSHFVLLLILYSSFTFMRYISMQPLILDFKKCTYFLN